MSNSQQELVNRFNELIEYYTVHEDFGLLVDLDGWSTGDLLDMLCIIEELLERRGEEMPLRDALDATLGEYDAMRNTDTE